MREEFGIPDSEMHRRYFQINLQKIGASTSRRSGKEALFFNLYFIAVSSIKNINYK
jgi:hypothetical protein